MKFLISAVTAFVVSLALVQPTVAAPALPSQCPGVIADYNVIDKSNVAGAIVTGTSGADFIILRNGIVFAGGGNDCVLFAGGPKAVSTTGIAFGEAGNDVIIRPNTGLPSGQAYGDYQTSPVPIYSDTPLNAPCDDEDLDESNDCNYGPIGYLPEGTDHCIGKWAYRLGCESIF